MEHLKTVALPLIQTEGGGFEAHLSGKWSLKIDALSYDFETLFISYFIIMNVLRPINFFDFFYFQE